MKIKESSALFIMLVAFLLLFAVQAFNKENETIELAGQVETLEIKNKGLMQENKELMQENKNLVYSNDNLGEYLSSLSDYWEDRYNAQSEKDHEELLVYVDYYVRQKNIIEGLLCEKDCEIVQSKEIWRIDYANLFEDFCFSCGHHKERHLFLVEESKKIGGCNNCY